MGRFTSTRLATREWLRAVLGMYLRESFPASWRSFHRARLMRFVRPYTCTVWRATSPWLTRRNPPCLQQTFWHIFLKHFGRRCGAPDRSYGYREDLARDNAAVLDIF